MSSTIPLPSHVKTILITGAGGYVGQKLTELILAERPDVKLITTDIRAPPSFGVDESKLKPVAADLGKAEDVQKLFAGERVQGVFALHGIMSGASESDFKFGYAVNLYSHLNLLAAMAAHAEARPSGEPLPVYVNTSSLAVYGGEKATPLSTVDPQSTPLVPETSYGVSKSIIELVTYDYSRKGFINGRSVRLPTVCIRTGAPSSAASSFISGLIREPLMGQPAVCPIASSKDDPILENMPIYVTRSKTVVENIFSAMGLDEKKLLEVGGNGVGKLRTINLPGVKINTKDILAALKSAGGQKALDLVTYEKDPKVIAICETWAGDYDSSVPVAMGFKKDDDSRGFQDAVDDFVKGLK